MMKKHLALLMLLVLVVGMAACGGKPAETTLPTTQPGTEATTLPTTEPTTVPTEPAVDLRFGNVDLTGMTAEQAVQTLTDAAASYKLALTVNGTAVLIPGADIGMAVNADAVAQCLAVTDPAQELPMVFTYDRDAVTKILGGKLNRAAKNARITFSSSKNQFTAVDGEEGVEYDLNAAADAAAQAIARLTPAAEIQVGTTKVAPSVAAGSEKIKTALNKANGYLNVSLKYTYSPEGSDSATETIGAGTLAGFISISDDLSVSVSKSAIESYASQMSSKHSGADYKGKFVTTGGSTTSLNVTYYGQKVNKSALADDIYKCVTEGVSGTRTAPYAAKSSKPYGGSYIEIDLSSQKLWLYKNGERITSTSLVSGSVAEDCCTPTGVYSIYAKQTDRYLTGADYRSFVSYWMPFLGGYGLHDASWRGSFGGDIYLYNGSHGCVNLPTSAAKTIYNNISVGTKVILYGGKREVPDLEQKLTGTTSYTVNEGDQSFKLDVKAKYKDAKLTYTSSDTNVVTVSSNGTVTIKGAGTATITVKAEAFEFYTAAELKVTITVKSAETQPTEPSKPTEPSQPTEPSKPTEPPTQPTEPPTQPTDPPTQPTEPPTQPTDPPTQPTEPPTQPTEPPTQPSEPAPSEEPAE